MNTKITSSYRASLQTLSLAALLALTSTSAIQAAGTWDGGGANGEFTNNLNWVGDVTPGTPFDGIFINGSAQTAITFAAPAAFVQASSGTAALTFASTTNSFSLSGADITVTGIANFTPAIQNLFTGRTNTINNNIILSGAAASINAAGTNSHLIVNGNINNGGNSLGLAGSSANLTVNGVISGAGGLVVNGNATGSTILTGTNTYTGATTVFRTLIVTTDALVSTNGSLGNASTRVQLGSSGGNLTPTLLTGAGVTVARDIHLISTGANPASVNTLGGNSAHTSTFSGSVTLNTVGGGAVVAQNLTVTAATGGRVNFTGNIMREGAATGTADTFTKIGGGIVALSGTLNNQGANLVSAGTLLINGTMATNGANVAVSAGATLGGAGTINRSVSLAGNASLSAGDMSGSTSLVGTLTLGAGTTSGLTLLNDNVVRFDLQQGNFTVGGGVNDLVAVGGQLTLDGTLVVTELGGTLTNGTYRLFNYTGALTDNTLAIDAGFLATHTGSFIDTSVANQINLVVVPEPAAAALAALGLTTLMVFRRRR